MISAKLSQQLRASLKELNLTHEQFARRLGVSLPTARRWLKGEGISLSDWGRVLETLGLDLEEFVRKAGVPSKRQFTYTEAQEAALANTPGLLAYLDLLLAGKTAGQIAKAHSLKAADSTYYLAKLEKLELIEWLPGDRVKVLVEGEPRWNPGGPLAKKFREQILRDFLATYSTRPENLRAGIYRLSAASQAQLGALSAELLRKLRTLELNDKDEGARTDAVTVLLGQGAFLPTILKLSDSR